jgi:hypothetical protein
MNEGNAQRYWISLSVSTCRFIDIVDSCRTDISYSCDLKLCLDPIRPVNSSSIGPTWHPTHATILHLLLFGPPSLVRRSSRLRRHGCPLPITLFIALSQLSQNDANNNGLRNLPPPVSLGGTPVVLLAMPPVWFTCRGTFYPFCRPCPPPLPRLDS